LIWVESNNNLCIKSKGKIFTIGSTTNNDDNTMTESELIASLQNLGIIVFNDNNNYDIKLNNISEITFIHQESGKKFNLQIDSEGKLRSTLINDILLENRLKNITLPEINSRGFISKLRIAEENKLGNNINSDKDVGLLSDRLKIGAVYAPIPERTLFGCSHAYIELENTSDQDINLKGCSL
jgi:hypothetical protein